MFGRYYSIKTFWHATFLKKIWRNCVAKFVLSVCGNPWKRHIHYIHFENATSRAQTNVMVRSRFYVCHRAHYWCWCHFLWWPPECLHLKPQNLCINSTWTALLIQEFLPVKTWLLIAFGTAFHAIMPFKTWLNEGYIIKQDQQINQFFLKRALISIIAVWQLKFPNTSFCQIYMSHIARKPVFGVCNQIRLKPVWSAREAS